MDEGEVCDGTDLQETREGCSSTTEIRRTWRTCHLVNLQKRIFNESDSISLHSCRIMLVFNYKTDKQIQPVNCFFYLVYYITENTE